MACVFPTIRAAIKAAANYKPRANVFCGTDVSLSLNQTHSPLTAVMRASDWIDRIKARGR